MIFKDLTRLAQLLKNGEVQFALVRLATVPQDGQSGIRDICITWTAPNSGLLKRRKCYEVQDTVDGLFRPYHAKVSVSNREKFDVNKYVYHLAMSKVWFG